MHWRWIDSTNNANCVELNSTNNALCVELISTNNAFRVELNSTNNASALSLNSTTTQKQRTLFRVQRGSVLCSFDRTFSLIIFSHFLPSSTSFEGQSLLQRTRDVMAYDIFEKNYMRITRSIWATNLTQPISLISLFGFWPAYSPREIRKKTISKFIF